MEPLGPATGPSRVADVAGTLIKPNSRLTSGERLDIYRRSYWCRLLDSFRDDFPGLAAVLGSRAFEKLARAYLADCPSQSYTLRDLGSRLGDWLSGHPEFAGSRAPLALDMVRLEWAHIVAFDGPTRAPLGPGHLARLKPGLRVGLQPSLSLLHVSHPVDDIRIRTNADREGSAAASNVANAKPPTSGSPVRQPRRQEIYLAVHRFDVNVYYRRLTAEEFRLLEELRSGSPIGRAVEACFQGSPVASDYIPELLEAWFSNWARFGWLTPRAKVTERSR